MSEINNLSKSRNEIDYRFDFYNEILSKEDIGPFIDCMNCGKCVGDCIAAENSDFNFRRIIQKILDNKRDEVLYGEEIWKCFLCNLCTIKCPKNINIKKLIMVLRKMAIDEGRGCKFLKYISDLPQEFIKKGLIVGKLNTNLREKLGLPKNYQLDKKSIEEIHEIINITGEKQLIDNFIINCKKEFIKSIIEGDKK